MQTCIRFSLEQLVQRLVNKVSSEFESRTVDCPRKIDCSVAKRLKRVLSPGGLFGQFNCFLEASASENFKKTFQTLRRVIQ